MSDSSISVSNEVKQVSTTKQTRITRQSNRENTENNQKLSAQKLFNQISRTISAATKHQLLTYEGVDSKTGSSIAESLDEDKRVEVVGHR